jgi:hypothetical protein
MFYDLETRELLRTRKNPLSPEQVKGLRGVRPAGPPPRPSAEPVRVQRRASNTGVIRVVGQKIALGPSCKHQTVTVLVSETTLAAELGDGDVRVIRRTTTQPVCSIKRPVAADRYLSFLDHVQHIIWRTCVAHLADMRRRSVVGSQSDVVRGHPGQGSDTGQGRVSRCCTECRRDLWVPGVSQSTPSRAIM